MKNYSRVALTTLILSPALLLGACGRFSVAEITKPGGVIVPSSVDKPTGPRKESFVCKSSTKRVEREGAAEPRNEESSYEGTGVKTISPSTTTSADGKSETRETSGEFKMTTGWKLVDEKKIPIVRTGTRISTSKVETTPQANGTTKETVEYTAKETAAEGTKLMNDKFEEVDSREYSHKDISVYREAGEVTTGISYQIDDQPVQEDHSVTTTQTVNGVRTEVSKIKAPYTEKNGDRETTVESEDSTCTFTPVK